MCHRRCRRGARLLDTGRIDKTDVHDARARGRGRVAALEAATVMLEDHSAVLRLLAKRHHDLVAHRTRAICRLHTVLCLLTPGGLPRQLSAARAALELRRIRPADQVGIERRRLAGELLTEVRAADRDLVARKARITSVVDVSSTTVTPVIGVGPIMAAYLIGYRGDVRRFPTAGHYARYNATAPIEASSGPRYVTASTRVGTGSSTTRCPSPPSPRSAPTHQDVPTTSANKPTAKVAKKPSAPKRRISDAVYRQLLADTTH